VCVLSVGRSGTSLAARVLNLLGVDLGPPAGMLPASDWNPRGFWEQQAILEVNEAVLEMMGGSYYEPPPLPRGWESDPALDPLRERALGVVEQLFAGSPRWGFKDPRTVLTLPFWRTVVGPMAYVICARHPLEVAGSLTAADGRYDRDHYLRLWLRSNAGAIEQTRDEPRVFVLNDEWFSAGRSVAERLARLVHGSAAVLDEEAWSRVAAEIDPSLHRVRAVDGRQDGVPVEAAAMWLLLQVLAARDRHDDADPATEQLAASAAALAAPLLAGHASRQELEERLATSRTALDTVVTSRSWRLTAPLRAAGDRLRTARRRP
jgi:hypothetical protein